MTTTTTATTSTTTTTTTSTTTTTTTSTTAAREKGIANGFYSSTVSTVSFSEMKNLFVSQRVSFSSFRINREKFQPKASKGFKQLRVTRHLRMLGFLIVSADTVGLLQPLRFLCTVGKYLVPVLASPCAMLS